MANLAKFGKAYKIFVGLVLVVLGAILWILGEVWGVVGIILGALIIVWAFFIKSRPKQVPRPPQTA